VFNLSFTCWLTIIALDDLSPYPSIVTCIPIYSQTKFSIPAVALIFLEQVCKSPSLSISPFTAPFTFYESVISQTNLTPVLSYYVAIFLLRPPQAWYLRKPFGKDNVQGWTPVLRRPYR
jgi:hypothetical protein